MKQPSQSLVREVLERHVSEGVLSTSEGDVALGLVALGQQHLFEAWLDGPPAARIRLKRRFVASLRRIDRELEGGLANYLKTARSLLRPSSRERNPYKGFSFEAPRTTPLAQWNENYPRYEQAGLNLLGQVAFVLVAGGLGERLGHPGIKLEIPFSLVAQKTFFEHYADLILRFESQAKKQTKKATKIPLLVMTSPDTHAKTKSFLNRINYGGLRKSQVEFLRQLHVPALANTHADLVLRGPFELLTKPHGHGDIHKLLFSKNIPNRLSSMGKGVLFFLQDTNPHISNVALSSLGVFAEQRQQCLVVGVQKERKERIGSLVSLRKKTSSVGNLCNIEYNHIDDMVRSGNLSEEQVRSFPGNTNMLLVDLDLYAKVLSRTKGKVPEFINPKVAEGETTFLKPARLESMMQDLLLQLPSRARTGVVEFQREWAFAPAKNAPTQRLGGRALSRKRFLELETLSSCEWAFYLAQATLLQHLGVRMPNKKPVFGANGIQNLPRVFLSPSFFISTKDLQKRMKNVVLHEASTLSIEGEDLSIDGLTLSKGAALVVRLAKKASLKISKTILHQKGFSLRPAPTSDTLRGYAMEPENATTLDIREPGNYSFIQGKLSKTQ